MKIKLFISVLSLVLLLSGCRSLEDKQADNETSPPVSAALSPAAPETYLPEPGGGEASPGDEPSPAGRTPQGEDSGPAEQSGSTSPPDDTAPSSAQPEGPDIPASGGSDPSAAASDGTVSNDETSAVLDDILEQLNDLDQLYSQLDDVQDYDLSD